MLTYFGYVFQIGMSVLERGPIRGHDSGDSDTEIPRIPVRSLWDYIEKTHKKSQLFFNFMYTPTPHSQVS